MSTMYDKSLDWLREEARRRGGPGDLAEDLAAPRATVYKVLNQGKNTNAQDYLAWLEAMGARIVFPGEQVETAREVVFADPRVVGVREYAQLSDEARVHPHGDDYLAVPLVEQAVAAGPGLAPEHSIKDWVIVWRWQEAIRGKSNLVAVRVGRDQTSMTPTLHPGDIVLLDRSDIHREPRPPGNIYCIQEPGPDYGLAVKRVVFERQSRRLRIVFYSDNAVDYPPRTYDFETDYEGDIARALVGRVIWAWSDMTRK